MCTMCYFQLSYLLSRRRGPSSSPSWPSAAFFEYEKALSRISYLIFERIFCVITETPEDRGQGGEGERSGEAAT